jgi:hypothetical protein
VLVAPLRRVAGLLHLVRAKLLHGIGSVVGLGGDSTVAAGEVVTGV